jgi:hypothetical protein
MPVLPLKVLVGLGVKFDAHAATDDACWRGRTPVITDEPKNPVYMIRHEKISVSAEKSTCILALPRV